MGVLTDTVTLRRATVDDVPTVVHFGSLMFQFMGEDDVSWVPHAEHVLREGIEQGRMVAVVAEENSNGGTIVSTAVGVRWYRLPSPSNQLGRGGYVQYVWTEPAFRGRGLARRVLDELIAWFREQGIVSVDLHATSVAESVYRSLGFAETDNVALRLHL